MLSQAISYFIDISLPSGYEPLAYLVEALILVWILDQFYKMIRMIIGRQEVKNVGDASLIFAWFSSAIQQIWTTLYSGSGWLGTFVIAAAVIRFAWRYIKKVVTR